MKKTTKKTTKKMLQKTMKKYLLTFVLLLAIIMQAMPAYAASGMDNFKATATYSATTYSDVKSNLWYAVPVKTCFEYKLMNGNGAGQFLPDGELSVAEAIVMACRVHQIYNTGENTLKNGSPWYQTYVDYAINNGIIKSADFTDYNAKITRAQMSYIFANAIPEVELTAKNNITTLPDLNTSDKYASSIYKLYNAGVLSGADAYGTFNPNSKIARREAAAIIARVAIPSQRLELILLEKHSNGILSISMPQASTYELQDGTHSYTAADSLTVATINNETQSSFSGLSITLLDVDYLSGILIDELKDSGITASVQKSSTVSFGNVKAYKYELAINNSGVNMTAYAYMFIDRSTLYEVNFVSVNTPLLKKMDSLFTVNGNYSK